MKTTKLFVSIAMSAVFLAGPMVGLAAEEKKAAKAYPLKTCLVSGEKLDAMGQPYVFTYKDQEIKLCCKGCLKAFNKDPEKHLKKLAEEEKKAK